MNKQEREQIIAIAFHRYMEHTEDINFDQTYPTCFDHFKESNWFPSIPEADEWIDPNKQLPAENTEVICKVEKLAFCVTDHAVGCIKSYPGKTVWMIEGHHVTHYKDAVNNCVIKWKPIN